MFHLARNFTSLHSPMLIFKKMWSWFALQKIRTDALMKDRNHLTFAFIFYRFCFIFKHVILIHEILLKLRGEERNPEMKMLWTEVYEVLIGCLTQIRLGNEGSLIETWCFTSWKSIWALKNSLWSLKTSNLYPWPLLDCVSCSLLLERWDEKSSTGAGTCVELRLEHTLCCLGKDGLTQQFSWMGQVGASVLKYMVVQRAGCTQGDQGWGCL